MPKGVEHDGVEAEVPLNETLSGFADYLCSNGFQKQCVDEFGKVFFKRGDVVFCVHSETEEVLNVAIFVPIPMVHESYGFEHDPAHGYVKTLQFTGGISDDYKSVMDGISQYVVIAQKIINENRHLRPDLYREASPFMAGMTRCANASMAESFVIGGVWAGVVSRVMHLLYSGENGRFSGFLSEFIVSYNDLVMKVMSDPTNFPVRERVALDVAAFVSDVLIYGAMGGGSTVAINLLVKKVIKGRTDREK